MRRTRERVRTVVRLIAHAAARCGTVSAMFLSKAEIRRGGTEAPCVRLTTTNLPLMGLRGGIRFWAIDGPPNADAIRDRLREYEVMALDEVPALGGRPDGVSEILALSDARFMSDAVVRGNTRHRCMVVAMFFTKSRHQPGDPDDAGWTDGDGAAWTGHRWRGAFDSGGDVAPERGLAHFLFVDRRDAVVWSGSA